MSYKTPLEKLYVLDSPYESCSESYLERVVRDGKQNGYIPNNDFETVLEDLLTSRVQFRGFEAERDDYKRRWEELHEVAGENVRLREALLELFGASQNEMVSRGLPLEWQKDCAMGRAEAALAEKVE